MTKRTKRALFYTSVVIFVLISYVAILYAQGYKYDFSKNQFYKTGTLALKVNTDATVYLDNNPIGGTSFLGNSFSKAGLLPRSYVVKVTKDNYSVWQKQFSITEGLVTEFPHVIIAPQNGTEEDTLKKEIGLIFNPVQKSPSPSVSSTPKPSAKPKTSSSPSPSISPEPYYIKDKSLFQTLNNEPNLIAKNAVDFAVSGDNKKIMWWNSKNEIWVYWLDDTNYQPFQKKGDLELVGSFSGIIKKAAWYGGNDHIVADLGNHYEILELDKRGGENVIKI